MVAFAAEIQDGVQVEGMQASMRDRILAAAISVMRERGVTNTTTKEIARAAGVAEGSIYNHFANKTELVAACMAEVAGGIREALARLSERAGGATVETNLTELAEAEIAFFTDLLPIVGPVLGDHDLRAWLRQGGPHGEPVTGHGRAGARQARYPGGVSGRTGTQAAAPPPSPAGSRHQDTLDGTASVDGPVDGPGPPAGTGTHATGIPPGPVLGHAVLAGYLEAEQRRGRLTGAARPAYLAASLIGACQQYAFVRLLTSPETMAELAGLPDDPAEYAREVVRAVMAGHLARPDAP